MPRPPLPRWLLPVILLGVIGLALWFWRGQSVDRNAPGAETEAPDPGYVSLDSEFIQTDDNGEPTLRLKASRVERGADGAPIRLTQPVIDYGPGDRGRWQLSAAAGSFDTLAQQVSLDTQVTAAGRLGQAAPLAVHTESLQLDLARQSVSSTVGVTVDQGDYRLAACRFEADLKRQSLKLESYVMVRKRVGAWAATPLALLCVNAGAADAPATAPPATGSVRCADGSRGDPVLESRGGLEAKPSGMVLRDVIITQCDNRIQADMAESNGIQFDDSRWQFSGHVQISVRRGSLAADQATVSFAHGQIATAVARGAPASFSQPAEGANGPAGGHADEISYDAANQQVLLTGKAWLRVGRAEVNVERIRYNIAERRVQTDAEGSDNGRVRITIQPKAEGGTPPDNAGKP